MLRYQKIERDLGRLFSNSPAADCCVRIINFVVNHDEQLSRHLTYQHLGKILQVDPASDVLQTAISILCSRFRALHYHMEFFDEKGEPVRLTDGELSHFLQTGALAHPQTGRPIDDPSGHLVPFVSASRSELLSEANND